MHETCPQTSSKRASIDRPFHRRWGLHCSWWYPAVFLHHSFPETIWMTSATESFSHKHWLQHCSWWQSAWLQRPTWRQKSNRHLATILTYHKLRCQLCSRPPLISSSSSEPCETLAASSPDASSMPTFWGSLGSWPHHPWIQHHPVDVRSNASSPHEALAWRIRRSFTSGQPVAVFDAIAAEKMHNVFWNILKIFAFPKILHDKVDLENSWEKWKHVKTHWKVLMPILTYSCTTNRGIPWSPQLVNAQQVLMRPVHDLSWSYMILYMLPAKEKL